MLSPSKLRTRLKNGFTVVELLVVIAIMAIIAVAALPSLRGLSSAQNLTASGNTVASLVDWARANAMAKNQPTAVVAVTRFSSDTNFNYRTAACFQLDGSNAWGQVTRWRQLPDTVHLDSGTSTPGAADFFQAAPPLSPPFPAPPLAGHAVDAFAYQVFLPSGQLYGQTAPVTLRLVDAHPTGSQTNSYTIFINQDTGRIKIVRP